MINVHYSGSLIAGKTDRMQDYPCFCLNSAANNDWVYALVAELGANNRIDDRRNSNQAYAHVKDLESSIGAVENVETDTYNDYEWTTTTPQLRTPS